MSQRVTAQTYLLSEPCPLPTRVFIAIDRNIYYKAPKLDCCICQYNGEITGINLQCIKYCDSQVESRACAACRGLCPCTYGCAALGAGSLWLLHGSDRRPCSPCTQRWGFPFQEGKSFPGRRNCSFFVHFMT